MKKEASHFCRLLLRIKKKEKKMGEYLKVSTKCSFNDEKGEIELRKSIYEKTRRAFMLLFGC